MLLAEPYLLVASICTTLIEDGGPGWLNLLVLVSIYDALKFIVMRPVSLLLLARVRLRERRKLERDGCAPRRRETGSLTTSA